MGLYGTAEASSKQRLCFCPECGTVYYTVAENCRSHPVPRSGWRVFPLLVDLDAELLLK